MVPLSYTAPRLTTSQHATPCAAATGFGSYFHFMGAPGCVRSSAYSTLGNGVTMYIVLFTTRGAASCPRTRPVENVAFTINCFTDSGVNCSSELNRVLAKSLAGRTQSPLSSGAGIRPGDGGAG